jgi:DNA repair protein RecN (Recombination protein N)
MLKELHVRNYALLDNVSVSFDQGFTVFTGETGAGKSLLAGALGVLLGQKVSESIIRDKSQDTEITGLLDIAPESEAAQWLDNHDISYNSPSCLLRRVIKPNGRSQVYIESSLISSSDLADLSKLLFDLHGQHEHQSLYSKDNHRKLLDKAAGLNDDVEIYTKLFYQLKANREALKQKEEEYQQWLAQKEFLNYALEEIAAIDPKLNEKDELLDKLKSLESYEKISQALQDFLHLTQGSQGALVQLKEAQIVLKSLPVNMLDSHIDRLSSTIIEIEDITQDFVQLHEQQYYSPEELENIHKRVAILQKLEKKYGGSIASVLQFAEQTQAKLQHIDDNTAEQELLKQQCNQLENQIFELAKQLSHKRHAYASLLQQQAEHALHELSMPSARFVIQIKDRIRPDGQKAAGNTGIDDIEFLFSANAGYDVQPLKNIASGGEASRVLLALKSIMALSDPVDCLIFDEIDTGIGGQTAVLVAKYLQKLSQHKQVLCITHLASIAAHADWHMKIEKNDSLGQAYTHVIPITNDERGKEIARMLSGHIDATALDHAKQLLTHSRRITT